MKKYIVAPSILSADFLHLEKDLQLTKTSGAEWLHFDVMDGHFVPNITYGSIILRQVKKVSDLVMDVHLMISDPDKYCLDFITSGADYLTFHYEALENNNDIKKLIHKIKENGCKVGISIKPKTPVEVLYPLLPLVDLILIMAVEPGFGGQSFMPISLDKIAKLRAEIDLHHYECLIEVDGGINDKTAQLVKQSGADVLVAGSYLFGQPDFIERVAKLSK